MRRTQTSIPFVLFMVASAFALFLGLLDRVRPDGAGSVLTSRGLLPDSFRGWFSDLYESPISGPFLDEPWEDEKHEYDGEAPEDEPDEEGC